MKSKYLMTIMAALVFAFFAGNAFAQDNANDAALSMLKAFLADPASRAEYAAKNPEAKQAEQYLQQFPPHIQNRLDKIVLMIMQESLERASGHVDAMKQSGPESAFNSFSPAVQAEIQALARELENDPEFKKKQVP